MHAIKPKLGDKFDLVANKNRDTLRLRDAGDPSQPLKVWHLIGWQIKPQRHYVASLDHGGNRVWSWSARCKIADQVELAGFG